VDVVALDLDALDAVEEAAAVVDRALGKAVVQKITSPKFGSVCLSSH
jgi:hypothetical protein